MLQTVKTTIAIRMEVDGGQLGNADKATTKHIGAKVEFSFLTKPNQTKPNQTKPNQTKPNQTKPNQTKPKQTTPSQNKPPCLPFLLVSSAGPAL